MAKENTDEMFNSDELFVLTGKEIFDLIVQANLSQREGKDEAKKMAVNIRDLDDCEGSRRRCLSAARLLCRL